MNESTNHIDALLRRRLLEELPPPTPPSGGWAALEQELEADMDLTLKAALTSLAAPQVAGWQALEQKLDPRSVQDVSLADKLNSLQPGLLAGSWERLSSRMDTEQAERVDAIVSDGLARAGTGATSGWAALAARLELIGWRRGVVSAWKVMEGALLLSFILLMVRFGPVLESPYLPVAVAEAPIVLAAEEPAVVAEVVSKKESLTPVAAKASSTALVPPAIPTPLALAEAVPMATSMASEANVETSALTIASPPAAAPEISSLPILALPKAVRLPSPALQLPEMQQGDPVQYFANAFVSPFDVNEVVTPATSIGQFDISGDRRFTQGSTVGLLLDVQQGKNGLQFGASYARRSFIPAALKWYLQDEYEHTAFEPVRGYSRFRYENITFSFNYKRAILEKTNWRVSARIGMSLSVIAQSSFEGQEDVVAGFNALAERASDAPPSSSQRSLQREVDFSGRHQLENPPKGWLEGGSILTNSSFYLTGGIVVERLLDPRWSVYVSPTFGRVVYLQEDQGIGPYNDRIHIGNFRFGSRYRFGGK